MSGKENKIVNNLVEICRTQKQKNYRVLALFASRSVKKKKKKERLYCCFLSLKLTSPGLADLSKLLI
jgi:predicted ABC-type exoprotein transport system permease subunit